VSLKDIAKELNLSISTVSRAIRNVGELNPETRKAVLELARAHWRIYSSACFFIR
jgi:DNA-binding LacI/PurR family transcriptional regulator